MERSLLISNMSVKALRFVVLIAVWSCIAAAVDYTCLHSKSWMIDEDDHYNSVYATSTGLSDSRFVSGATSRTLTDATATYHLRRSHLNANPPPPPPSQPPASGGSGSSQSFETTLTTGWRITTTGIPNYDRVFTLDDITALNARPKASTDFTTGQTTIAAGSSVVFGESIGYTTTSCSDGYWPPGPGCPTVLDDNVMFSLQPAPELNTGGCYVGGKIGFNVEGIDLWSWSDASSYNSGDVWHSLAMKFERYDMDICRGHAANGVYHHHSHSPCLAVLLNDTGTAHSPVHGFAYDGFPIYGPYQAAEVLAVSCWQARNYASTSATGCSSSTRSCLLQDETDYTQGTKTASAAGPALTGTINSMSGNALSAASGIYYEDYFFNASCYAQGGAHLNVNNGHDHDGLGFHYHMTLDSALYPTFPYTAGPKFYGCVSGQSCFNSHAKQTSTTTSTCGTSSAAALSSVCADSPSVQPTLAPTSPSAIPTAAPSDTPTLVPTRIPTGTPTTAPSNPTATPTHSPTVVPSVTPTTAPSLRPTPTPSVQTKPIISFTASFVMTGSAVSTLDTAAQQALINATAAAMKIETTFVEYTGDSSVQTSRRLTYHHHHIHDHFRPHQIHPTLSPAVYVLTANTTVTVPLASYPDGADAAELLATLESALQTAVCNGDFVAKLSFVGAYYGSQSFDDITLSVSTSHGTISDPANTDSDDSAAVLSTGAIVGIAVGGAFAIIAMVALLAYCIKQEKSTTSVSPSKTSDQVVVN